MSLRPDSHLARNHSLQGLDFNIADNHADGTKSEPSKLPFTEDVTILVIESEWVAALNLHFQLINLGY